MLRALETAVRPEVQGLALRVVFVDWHGVMSRDPFWWSILTDDNHWLARRLRPDVERLFTADFGVVQSWMRGRLTYHDVVAEMGTPLDRRCRPDYLERRLVDDCKRMRVSNEILDVIRAAPALTLSVLATDNMDCFIEAMPGMPQIHGAFHGALCSADLGVLKAEDPEAFFGECLRDAGLGPSRALLVDDSPANCAAFRAWGGHAIEYRGERTDLAQLREWLGLET